MVIHPPLKRFFVFSCHYFRVAPTTKNRELFCMPRLPLLCCESHRNSWHSFTYRAVFEEGPGIFGNRSTFGAVFVEGPWIFGHSSTYRAFFVEEFVFFRLYGPETCPPGALYPRFRTWWGQKPAHQAHFCRVFAPGAFVRLGKDFVKCFG